MLRIIRRIICKSEPVKGWINVETACERYIYGKAAVSNLATDLQKIQQLEGWRVPIGQYTYCMFSFGIDHVRLLL